MKLLLCLALICIAFSVNADDVAPATTPQAPASYIIELTDQTFDSTLMKNNDKPWVIKFYNPDCYFSQLLAPIYEQLATEMHDQYNWGAVYSPRYMELEMRFWIRAYPTIYYIENNTMYQYPPFTNKTYDSVKAFVVDSKLYHNASVAWPFPANNSIITNNTTTTANTETTETETAPVPAPATQLDNNVVNPPATPTAEQAQPIPQQQQAEQIPQQTTHTENNMNTNAMSTMNMSYTTDFNNDNMDTILAAKSDKPWYLHFGASWCPHCQALHPVWEKVATDLHDTVNFGAVECSQYFETCMRFNVQAFPTLFVLDKGLLYEFPMNDFRTEETLKAFLTNTLKYHNTSFPIAFPALAAANTTNNTPEPVPTPQPEPLPAPQPEPVPTPQPEPVPTPQPEPVPTPQPKPVPTPQPEPVPTPTPTPVASYVTEFTDETFDALLAANKGKVWFVKFYSPFCPHCINFAPLFEELATDLHEDVSFGAVDCPKYYGLAQRFNIHAYPTLMLIDGDSMYQFSGQRNFTSIEDFILNTLKYHNTSQAIPFPALPTPEIIPVPSNATTNVDSSPTEASIVIELTDANFAATLNISTDGKPWIIKFTVPDCVLCIEMAELWTDFATEYFGKANVAEVNGLSSNQLKEKFQVAEFPTLVYYSNNTITSFKGARSLASLKEYTIMALPVQQQLVQKSQETATNNTVFWGVLAASVFAVLVLVGAAKALRKNTVQPIEFVEVRTDESQRQNSEGESVEISVQHTEEVSMA